MLTEAPVAVPGARADRPTTAEGRIVAQQVPYTGDERESLQASLNRHRDAVLWKLEGLDDADLRRAMLPSGNTLLGLVKHLATWECAALGGDPRA
jgi:hypothetical protein